MKGDYFLMGNSVSDRTNRMTLIKLVAQKLNIDREGYVDFYLLDGDIIVKKGTGEYVPENVLRGFYMGSSVVDKDNRITIIKLVVQNLNIQEGDRIEFYFHNEEVVIEKVNDLMKDYNPEESSKECHEAVAKICVDYYYKVSEYLLENNVHPSDEQEYIYLEEAMENADLSDLSTEDMNRLPFETEYVFEMLRKDNELCIEYNRKYSKKYERYNEIMRMLDERNSTMPEEDRSFKMPEYPKRSKLRKFFSKR
jgi:hypothetical protein